MKWLSRWWILYYELVESTVGVDNGRIKLYAGETVSNAIVLSNVALRQVCDRHKSSLHNEYVLMRRVSWMTSRGLLSFAFAPVLAA